MNKTTKLSPRAETSAAVRTALERAFDRLRQSAARARAGDAEAVHAMRKATRELRSILRTFRPLTDSSWVEGLRHELQWLGHALGDLRDVDVQQQRLRAAAGGLAGDLGPLWETLDREHETRLRRLRDALESSRYQTLMTRLAEASCSPRLNGEAHLPCKDVVPGLVAKLWRKARSKGRELKAESPDEQFHEVRKRAKRARHAAEAAIPCLGGSAVKPARRFHRRLLDLLDVLGEHQDAVVAQGWVERAGSVHGDDPAYQRALGRLRERQERAAQSAREGFADAWEQLDRKPLSRWMTS